MEIKKNKKHEASFLIFALPALPRGFPKLKSLPRSCRFTDCFNLSKLVVWSRSVWTQTVCVRGYSVCRPSQFTGPVSLHLVNLAISAPPLQIFIKLSCFCDARPYQPLFSVFHSYLSHECAQQSESPWDTRAAAPIFLSLRDWATAANFECRFYNIRNFSKGKNDSGVTKKLAFGPDKVCVYRIQWEKLEACLRLGGLFNTHEEDARRAKCEAFTLGHHERMGAGSLIAALAPDVKQLILERVSGLGN